MLKVRRDLAPAAPTPFSDAAADKLFDRLRQELSLPSRPTVQRQATDLDPTAWTGLAKRAGAVAVEF